MYCYFDNYCQVTTAVIWQLLSPNIKNVLVVVLLLSLIFWKSIVLSCHMTSLVIVIVTCHCLVMPSPDWNKAWFTFTLVTSGWKAFHSIRACDVIALTCITIFTVAMKSFFTKTVVAPYGVGAHGVFVTLVFLRTLVHTRGRNDTFLITLSMTNDL